MMGRGRLWELGEMRDGGLDLRMLERSDALSLARDLLPSRGVVARVFSRCQLTQEGMPLGREAILEPGSLVTLAFWRDDAVSTQPAPTADLSVVYQDALLIAVDKPAGVLVHGDGTGALTLTDQVRELLAGQGSAAVPQAVQRLDVETTGLTLFSLTEEFQPALDAQVAGHDMHKRYLAVVEGRLDGTAGRWRELAWPLGRDRHDARRMRVSPRGKSALTRVRTLAERAGRSLLLVELETGRRHQIRVHLAHAGHPLLGDVLYGGRSSRDGLMLHAFEERLVHPVSGMTVQLRTSWPDRFERLFPGVGRELTVPS